MDYAEKDRNGTRAALADNKQACKSFEALGSTDQTRTSINSDSPTDSAMALTWPGGLGAGP